MKSSPYNLIPVTIVKNYLWCRTYTWLSINGPTPVLPPHSHTQREKMHPIEIITLLEALGHKGHLIAEMKLEDPLLGLVGRVDYLAEPDPPPGAVVEYKPRGVWSNGEIEIIQTALYTIMAENKYQEHFKGYLVTGFNIVEVEDHHKARAMTLLAIVKRALGNPHPPRPGHDMTRCKSCIYRRLCPMV